MRITGGAGKGPPDNLEPGADRQHDGAIGHPTRQRAVVDEGPGGAHLGPSSPPPRQ